MKVRSRFFAANLHCYHNRIKIKKLKVHIEDSNMLLTSSRFCWYLLSAMSQRWRSFISFLSEGSEEYLSCVTLSFGGGGCGTSKKKYKIY